MRYRISQLKNNKLKSENKQINAHSPSVPKKKNSRTTHRGEFIKPTNSQVWNNDF